MEPEQRVVTASPLHELWNRNGIVAANERGTLSSDDIGDLLRVGKVRFMVADVSLSLQWVPLEQSYTFWKGVVKEHVVDPGMAESGFVVDDYPGAYCYLASLW